MRGAFDFDRVKRLWIYSFGTAICKPLDILRCSMQSTLFSIAGIAWGPAYLHAGMSPAEIERKEPL